MQASGASPRLRRLVLAGGIALYAALAITSLHRMSAIFDEGAQFPAGYSYWKFGDFRLNPEHPPLVKLLASLPLLFMDVTVREDSDGWRLGQQWEFGRRFLYSWNDGAQLLFWGRLVVVFLGCLLAALVFARANRLWGLAGASLALLLCVLSPEILAHGRVVTFDVGITLFFFLTVVCFERLAERTTWPRLLGAGLSLGAAFVTKESAITLLPILTVLAGWTAWLPEPIVLDLGGGRPPRVLATRRERAALMGLSLLAIGMIAVGVIWAGYGFHARLSPDPLFQVEWKRVWPEHQAFASAAAFVRRFRLLPDAYLFGFLEVFQHDTRGNVFLMGQIAPQGFHYYYPLAFLIKTPLALLILVAASVLLRKRWPLPLRSEGFLWLPVLVYFGLVLTRHVQNGHRHLLPIYPFLFVLAGRPAAWAASLPGRLPARLSVVALASWYAFAALSVCPHYFAYFNELVGGPANGYRYLVDSDLDWGQDLETLKGYLDANHIPKIKLSYFGSADPGFYGIDYELLPSYRIGNPHTWSVEPGDLVAVSATNLQGVYITPEGQPLMARLRGLTPQAKLGYSIFVYRADFALSRP